MKCAQRSNKSLSRQGSACSSLESGQGAPRHFPFESNLVVPFPSQDSVVHVNLSHLSHNAEDTASQCLPQSHRSILFNIHYSGTRLDTAGKTQTNKTH